MVLCSLKTLLPASVLTNCQLCQHCGHCSCSYRPPPLLGGAPTCLKSVMWSRCATDPSIRPAELGWFSLRSAAARLGEKIEESLVRAFAGLVMPCVAALLRRASSNSASHSARGTSCEEKRSQKSGHKLGGMLAACVPWFNSWGDARPQRKDTYLVRFMGGR